MSIGLPIAHRLRWIVAFAALTALFLALAGPADARGVPLREDPISRAAATNADRRLEVIVQLRSGADPDRTISRIRRRGARLLGRLPLINGFAAQLRAGDAADLARDGDVRAVTLNRGVEPQAIKESTIEPAFPFAVGATATWNSASLPATGKGVGVAVIDTGIAGALPDLRVSPANPASRVVASAVIHPDAVTAGDSYGHGTHVAGIIAGNGWNRSSLDPLLGRYVGVAPEASLIDVKVSDEAGNATVLDVIYGLQFVVDHKDALGIRVVNLSLESTGSQSYKTDPLDAAAEAAWFSGLVVVAAAGNRGTAADAVQYAPGNDPYVITVGASDDQATRGGGDDVMTGWSSRGVTQDGFNKPEIEAPGARIVSTLAPGSEYAALCPTCIVGTEMFRAGGTSMSAPMVAGVAALMLEKYPNLTPDQVKGTLVAAARQLPSGRREVYAYNALAQASAPITANAGLSPNQLIDTATGGIDYTRSSWSRSSWSSADGAEAAGWARSSWSRSSWSSNTTSGDSVEPSRSSWSRSSWSTSWTK